MKMFKNFADSNSNPKINEISFPKIGRKYMLKFPSLHFFINNYTFFDDTFNSFINLIFIRFEEIAP